MTDEESPMLQIERQHEEMARNFSRYFLGESSPTEAQRFRAHVRACAACQTEYEKWSGAERALLGSKAPVSELSLERLGRDLLPTSAPAEPKSSSVRPWAYVLASAASLLLAGRIFLGEGASPDEFTARGAQTPVDSSFAVRAVVARIESEGAPSVFDLGSSSEGLKLGDRVQLRISQAEPSFVRIFREQGGKVHASSPTLSLPAGDDVAVPVLLTVDETYPRGVVRFIVMSSVTATELEGQPSIHEAPDGPAVRVLVSEVLP